MTARKTAALVGLPMGILIVLGAAWWTFPMSEFPSGSMRPTLEVGDYIFVSRLSRSPERGDVVSFRTPADPRIRYVKRLIGVGGDRIQMIDGALHLNGEAVQVEVVEVDQHSGETVLTETLPGGASYRILDYYPGSMGDNTGIFVVPEDHYFFMGDNRDNSADSRFPSGVMGIGFVPAANLVGEVVAGLRE